MFLIAVSVVQTECRFTIILRFVSMKEFAHATNAPFSDIYNILFFRRKKFKTRAMIIDQYDNNNNNDNGIGKFLTCPSQ